MEKIAIADKMSEDTGSWLKNNSDWLAPTLLAALAGGGLGWFKGTDGQKDDETDSEYRKRKIQNALLYGGLAGAGVGGVSFGLHSINNARPAGYKSAEGKMMDFLKHRFPLTSAVYKWLAPKSGQDEGESPAGVLEPTDASIAGAVAGGWLTNLTNKIGDSSTDDFNARIKQWESANSELAGLSNRFAEAQNGSGEKLKLWIQSADGTGVEPVTVGGVLRDIDDLDKATPGSAAHNTLNAKVQHYIRQLGLDPDLSNHPSVLKEQLQGRLGASLKNMSAFDIGQYAALQGLDARGYYKNIIGETMMSDPDYIRGFTAGTRLAKQVEGFGKGGVPGSYRFGKTKGYKFGKNTLGALIGYALGGALGAASGGGNGGEDQEPQE